jgi:hypothetical protein
MQITIKKSMSNKPFVSNQDMEYHFLAFLTKRIWLSEPVSVFDDGNVLYELRLHDGTTFEGRIHGLGNDEDGFYLVFNLDPLHYTAELEELFERPLPLGNATLVDVFNPHTDKALRALCYEENLWPCIFNHTIMTYTRDNTGLTFRFCQGTLGHIGIILKLTDIVSERCPGEEDTSLEDFKNTNMTHMVIRKTEEDLYRVTFLDHHMEHLISGGPDPETGRLDAVITMHHRQYTLYARGLEVERYHYFLHELASRGITCTELHHRENGKSAAEELRLKWQEAFLSGVNTHDIYLDQFLWHAFSYERLPALKEQAAEEAFKAALKDTLYIFLQNSQNDTTDICYRLEKANTFPLELLKCYQDVYVTDEAFTWTYVRTHEEGLCGPYFYQKPGQ